MRIGKVEPDRLAILHHVGAAWRGRLRSRWDQGISARDAGVVGAAVAAASLVTGAVHPLPFQSHLVVPFLAGGVGWALGRRWGHRPEVVLWGILGFFAGMSAAQRLDSIMLMGPLAVAGTLIGVLVSSQTRESGCDRSATAEMVAAPPDRRTAP